MSDLIYRDDAYYAIESMDTLGTIDNENDSIISKEAAMSVIDSVPSASDWIPYDGGKRPDVYGEYLVYMAKSDMMMILSFSSELNSFGIWDDEITHWKPRPDKPNIEKD